MKSSSGQAANSHDQASMLNSPALVEKFWRHRAHLRILQRFDQILNPTGLRRFNVIVEKNETGARGGGRTEIAFIGEVERLVVRDKAHSGVGHFETLERTDQAAVRDDHDLQIRVFGVARQVVQTDLSAGR